MFFSDGLFDKCKMLKNLRVFRMRKKYVLENVRLAYKYDICLFRSLFNNSKIFISIRYQIKIDYTWDIYIYLFVFTGKK